MKLGRIIIRYARLATKIENELDNHLDISCSNDISDDFGKIDLKSNTDSLDKKSCRICFGEIENVDANPFINPCYCAGSLKYVHLFCLKQWMKSKINLVDNISICTIILNDFECELCHYRFNYFIYHNKEKLFLIDLPILSHPYSIFEIYDKEGKFVHELVLITFKYKKEILIVSIKREDLMNQIFVWKIFLCQDHIVYLLLIMIF